MHKSSLKFVHDFVYQVYYQLTFFGALTNLKTANWPKKLNERPLKITLVWVQSLTEYMHVLTKIIEKQRVKTRRLFIHINTLIYCFRQLTFPFDHGDNNNNNHNWGHNHNHYYYGYSHVITIGFSTIDNNCRS